jgi:hypothetical protein
VVCALNTLLLGLDIDFGWVQIKEPVHSLAELGGHQLYPADPSVGSSFGIVAARPALICFLDRRPALLSILRSMLVAYSALTGSLLEPPPPISSDVQPEWKRNAEWINVMAQNLMAAANDLRPVQASDLSPYIFICWIGHPGAGQSRNDDETPTGATKRRNSGPPCVCHLFDDGRPSLTLCRKCDALESKLAEMRASAQALLGAQTKTEKTVV